MRAWIVALLIGFCGSVAWGVWSTSKAEEEARAEHARAVELAKARERAEQHAADARARVKEIRDSLELVRDSVERVRADARRRAAAAAQAFEAVEERVRAAAADSAAVVELLDTLRVAHATQVRALRDELEAADRERRILWRQVQAQDTALARAEAVNMALQAEVISWKLQAESWERAARPGIAVRIGQNLLPAAVGLAAGIIIGR